MSSKLFNQANVLVQHIELVIGKIESIRMFVFKDCSLASAFNSKSGLKMVEFLQKYIKAKKDKKPKPSNSNTEFMKDNCDKIAQVVRACDYIRTWCHATRVILFKMTEDSAEFDIKWNSMFTTLLCKLFVAYSKVVIFIFMFPPIKLAVHCADFIPDFDTKCLSNPVNVIQDFITNCSNDPFTLLIRSRKDNKSHNISNKLGQLISQVGPILIQCLGQWPLINWEKFNVFSQKGAPETTFMDLEHICLANISLLKETVFYFVLTFPEFSEEHKQFEAIKIAVCSESMSVYLTRQYCISFTELLDFYDPKKTIIPDLMRKLIKSAMQIKIKLTHSKRMYILSSLINNMTSIASYDPNYLAKFVPDLISLCSFSVYEIDCALTSGDLSNQISDMIGILVKTSNLFSKNHEIVSRAFMYNLTTIDAIFLDQLLNNFYVESAEWQKHFLDLCSSISNDLKIIDLEDIDKGCNYDLTPMIFSIGRVITYFNQLKTNHSASHLQCVLEHLNAVLLHANFAQNPLQAFLSFSPIHELWRHITRIATIINDTNANGKYMGLTVGLCPYFNIDSLALSQNSGELQRILQTIQNIRASITKRIYSQLNSYVGKGSRIQEITNQNRFMHIFDSTKIIKVQSSNLQINYDEEFKFKDPIVQMRTLMMNMPGSFYFGGSEVKCAKYISDSITNCLATILFSEPIPDPLWVDSSFSAASQFIWPIFSLIGAPFPSKLLICRYEHAFDSSASSFLQQVSSIKTRYVQQAVSPEMLAKTKGVRKLINVFEEYVTDFLEKDCTNYRYYPHSFSFENIKSDPNSNIAPFFSYNSMVYMINNLGPYAGFAIDRILINHAAKTMKDIFLIQQEISSQLQVWYGDYIKGGQLWRKASTNPRVDEAALMVINLGMTFKIRSILREAMRDVIDTLISGLPDLIVSGMQRVSGELPENENLIIEMFAGCPQFHFLMGSLKRENISQTTDTRMLFFFFSLLLSVTRFSNIMYDSETEFISHNLHLFPLGMDGFINCLSIFSTAADSRDSGNGMNLFFDVMSSILQSMRSNPSISKSTQYAFIIVADLFPRSINSIEYGRIGKNFPPSVISEAYRSASSQNMHERTLK